MATVLLDGKWKKKLKRLGREVADKVTSRAQLETAEEITRTARGEGFHRYKTHSGDLNRSLSYQRQKGDTVIGFDESVADYGKYQNDGTQYLPSDNFVQRAVAKHRETYGKKMVEQYNRVVK